MFRSAPRIIGTASSRTLVAAPSLTARRCLSTAPPAHKRRSWKSLAARLGLAGAIVYYYNTTDVFGDDPRQLAPVHTLAATKETDQESLPTIESIAAERRQRLAVQKHLEAQREKEAAQEAARQGQGEQLQLAGEGAGASEAAAAAAGGPSDGQGIEGLEAEADQQGAFNPETGEINWDCPCLGGMAHGPCGDEFKAAFSCFVYSQEEPKGMDCIDKFKDMQNCFRQYPEIYGSEIDNDDDDDNDMTAAADVSTPSSSNPTEPALSGEKKDPAPAPATQDSNPTPPAPSGPHSAEKLAANRRELGLVPDNYKPAAKQPASETEIESPVPKAAHDGR